MHLCANILLVECCHRSNYVVTTCFSFPIFRVVPWKICSGELPTSWSAAGDRERRERRRGTPWSQPAWVRATGEGGMLLGIRDMASATAGEANRTHTARTTARSKATTPRNASSCAENSKDTTGSSKSTCKRGIRSRTRRRAQGGRSISAANVPKRLGFALEPGPSAGAAESATTPRRRTRVWRVCGPLPRRT